MGILHLTMLTGYPRLFFSKGLGSVRCLELLKYVKHVNSHNNYYDEATLVESCVILAGTDNECQSTTYIFWLVARPR